MSLSVTPTARDIIFTFPNSCNSNCCKPQTSNLYINSQGQVETYKQRKARENTERAFERSMSHLNHTLERKVVSFNGNAEVFQHKTSSILESIYALKTVNISHVEAINELMLEYLQETKASKSHVVFDDELIIPSMSIEEPSKLENTRCLIL